MPKLVSYHPVRTVYEKIWQGKLPISPHGKPYRIDRDGLFREARKKGGDAS